jgi:hypothetical protein
VRLAVANQSRSAIISAPRASATECLALKAATPLLPAEPPGSCSMVVIPTYLIAAVEDVYLKRGDV